MELLVASKNFDPDVEVGRDPTLTSVIVPYSQFKVNRSPPDQDGSGWTPLMIAASLKDAEGDPIIDMMLRKGADVNVKSITGQVSVLISSKHRV